MRSKGVTAGRTAAHGHEQVCPLSHLLRQLARDSVGEVYAHFLHGAQHLRVHRGGRLGARRHSICAARRDQVVEKRGGHLAAASVGHAREHIGGHCAGQSAAECRSLVPRAVCTGVCAVQICTLRERRDNEDAHLETKHKTCFTGFECSTGTQGLGPTAPLRPETLSTALRLKLRPRSSCRSRT